MKYQELFRKKRKLDEMKHLLSEHTVNSYSQAFDVEYTHHSTAIEGNTLTLLETEVVLEEGLSVGGKKLRELYEVVNHHQAFHIEMYRQIKAFYSDLVEKTFEDGIELAAWTHAEFVRIHPFVDGNGRTPRLIMNYQLMQHVFLPISIKKETRLEYFKALEAYAVHGELHPFAHMIAVLEEKQLDRYLSMIPSIIPENDK